MRSSTCLQLVVTWAACVALWTGCGGDDGAPADGAAAIDVAPVPDTAAPDAPPATCDGDHLVTAEGCGAGKCTLQFTPEFMIAIGCCPAGAIGLGGACNPTAAEALDHPGYVCDDCAPGLVCESFTCHQVCDSSSPVCPAGTSCTPISGVPDAPTYGECE
jgi:hypothetical protein